MLCTYNKVKQQKLVHSMDSTCTLIFFFPWLNSLHWNANKGNIITLLFVGYNEDKTFSMNSKEALSQCNFINAHVKSGSRLCVVHIQLFKKIATTKDGQIQGQKSIKILFSNGWAWDFLLKNKLQLQPFPHCCHRFIELATSSIGYNNVNVAWAHYWSQA